MKKSTLLNLLVMLSLHVWVSFQKRKRQLSRSIIYRSFFEVASLKHVADEMIMPLVYENIKDMEPTKKECDLYTGTNHERAVSFCRGQSLRCGVTKKIYTKIKDLSSEPLIGVKEPLKDMLAACGVIIVYLPIIDNITSTCITYSKGNSIVLGIPTEDSDDFWNLLDQALHNLVEQRLSTQ